MLLEVGADAPKHQQADEEEAPAEQPPFSRPQAQHVILHWKLFGRPHVMCPHCQVVFAHGARLLQAERAFSVSVGKRPAQRM